MHNMYHTTVGYRLQHSTEGTCRLKLFGTAGMQDSTACTAASVCHNRACHECGGIRMQSWIPYVAETIGRDFGVQPLRWASIVGGNARHPVRQGSLSCSLSSCCQDQGHNQ